MLRVVFFWGLLWSVDRATANELSWLTEPNLDVGLLADHGAEDLRLSNTGRYISFVSKANNLVNNDANHIEDLFIRDLQTETTQLVSVSQSGQQALSEGIYSFSRPSFDGRYVAFASQATEYPGGNGEAYQLYIKDLVTGELFNESGFGSNGMVEITSGELYLSDDGQGVIFSSRTAIDPLHVGNNSTQIYRKDLSDDSYTLLSTSLDGAAAADGDTHNEHVSSSGRYVLMVSRADNLSAEVINNSGDNLFVLDRLNDARTLINVTPGGVNSSDSEFSGWAGQVSNQGTVVFSSRQEDLVADDSNNRIDVFWYDSGTITRLNVDDLGNQLLNHSSFSDVAISGDGTRVAFTESSDEMFPSSTNGDYDLYAYDTATGVLTLVSQNALGEKANGHSYDPQLGVFGEQLLFTTAATDLTLTPTFGPNTSILQHDFTDGSMQQEHVAAFTPETVMDDINHVKISSDQLTVLLSSKSPNLVPEPLNDTLDLFVLNRDNGIMDRLAANISTYEPALSPSGRYVSFRTQYEPPMGLNSLGSYFLYRYDRQNNAFLQIAEGFNNRVNDQGVVVFDTFEDLVPNDSNGQRDVYAYNPNNGQVVLISEDMAGQAAGSEEFDFSGLAGELWVTYTSDNDQIVNHDGNGQTDVFLRQLGGGTVRISQTMGGTEANDQSRDPAISADGRWVAFITDADNLTADDYSGANNSQVLLYDRLAGDHTLVSLNQQGVPLTQAGTSGISQVAVSDAGRYVGYVFTDVDPDDNNNRGGSNPEFAGDTDGNRDLVLIDTATQHRQIVSRMIDGTETIDEVELEIQIRSDLTSASPTVGVVFMADHGSLTGRLGHPGHDEAYLYQQPIWNPDVIFLDDFE
ncbi:hypothetical protein [Marinicella meishanensis]|uniref:hypothetical protein n=1 Tax=Marinicella meishanensis TaxID=2873263 RepID=UPI001CBCAC8E|nr:hypothetical protein [Marinicella sp. NBU2979]